MFTVVVRLDQGDATTSMQIIGREAVVYAGAGSGFLFLSELWHRTVSAGEGVCKLTLFFGYFLKSVEIVAGVGE